MLKQNNIYGIIVPLPEESDHLVKSIADKQYLDIAGITYITGKIGGKNVVVVNSGLGTISAAIIATRLIQDFRPVLVLTFGSCGNINENIHKGEVVIGQRVINADLGQLTQNGVKFQFLQYLNNPQTMTDLPLVFDLQPELQQLVSELATEHKPSIILGNIATSDALPNHAQQIDLLRQGQFDVVEMEGAAVMQACWMFKTPAVVVRGVSNDAREHFTAEDVALAALNATKTVLEIVAKHNS